MPAKKKQTHAEKQAQVAVDYGPYEALAKHAPKKLTTIDKARLAVVAHMMKEDRGCLTPFESFFGEVMRLATTAVIDQQYPSPTAIAELTEDYARDVVDMATIASTFLKTYPEVEVRKAPEAA